MVTNHRVMKELPQSGYLFTLLLNQIDSIQVLNQHRDSNMGITGVGVRSGNIRSTQYQGQSRSKNVGDILFISKDHQDFNFVGIQDPKGQKISGEFYATSCQATITITPVIL